MLGCVDLIALKLDCVRSSRTLAGAAGSSGSGFVPPLAGMSQPPLHAMDVGLKALSIIGGEQRMFRASNRADCKQTMSSSLVELLFELLAAPESMFHILGM